MSALAPIGPINAAGLTPAALAGEPRLEWVKLAQLATDARYQRGLSERSVRLIRRIVEEFDWARVRPAVVIERPGGLYEILDGQHLATAAATHGGIEAIPCLIVADRDTAAKAAAFVALNRDRVAMTPIQVFRAKRVAGDPVALAVVAGLEKAGARMLERMPALGHYEIGDTVAVSAFEAVATSKGAAGVARVARVAINARRAPISSMLVRAVWSLVWSREYAGAVSDTQIAAWLVTQEQGAPELAAKARAKTLKITAHAALTQIIYQEAGDD